MFNQFNNNRALNRRQPEFHFNQIEIFIANAQAATAQCNATKIMIGNFINSGSDNDSKEYQAMMSSCEIRLRHLDALIEKGSHLWAQDKGFDNPPSFSTAILKLRELAADMESIIEISNEYDNFDAEEPLHVSKKMKMS